MRQTRQTPNFGNIKKEEALPEPRRVKREILWARNKAEDEIIDARKHNSSIKTKQVFSAISKLFMKVRSYMQHSQNNSGYRRLKQIKQMLENGTKGKVKSGDMKKLVQSYWQLDDLIFELGITRIGIEKKTQPYGYEFLSGLPFDMDKGNTGWERLKENVRNMKKLLREDTDFMGIVWGGNRVGKTTLSLLLASLEEEEFGDQNIVITEKDFWNSTEGLNQYSSIHIDEFSRLFYSLDAMQSDNKKRKRKLKTFAKKNMFLIGCDTSFFKIDKEVRNDKLKFAIRVPRRGHFEFYNMQKTQKIEKDPDTGEALTPSPTFTGRFPKLEGELWQKYKEVEDKKMEENKEEAEEDKLSISQMVELVKKRKDYFINEYNKRRYIKKSLIKAEFDVGEGKADQVKDKAEADLGLPEKTEKDTDT